MKEKIYLRLVYDHWRRILPRFTAFEQGSMILECGTGPGHLLGFMEEWFPEAAFYGLDNSPEAVSKARRGTKRTQYVLSSAEFLPFFPRRFDTVLSFHMVEHLPEPQRFLQEAARVLRPGGILVLATPNPQGIGARLMKARWSGLVPEHISLLPPGRWRELLVSCGFAILRDGTTGLSGVPVFRKLPLGLLNWVPMFLFGFFPWQHGEAYICIARKEGPGDKSCP